MPCGWSRSGRFRLAVRVGHLPSLYEPLALLSTVNLHGNTLSLPLLISLAQCEERKDLFKSDFGRFHPDCRTERAPRARLLPAFTHWLRTSDEDSGRRPRFGRCLQEALSARSRHADRSHPLQALGLLPAKGTGILHRVSLNHTSTRI